MRGAKTEHAHAPLGRHAILNGVMSMNKLMILPLAAATALAAGCASNGLYGGVGAGASSGRYDDGGYGYYDQNTYSQYGNYDYDRPTRATAAIMPTIITAPPPLQERRLASNDRVYRGRDNKYYCRRNDGRPD